MTTGKTIALTRWIFVDKVMALLLSMLSRLVITFLPRSKRLLISWLQSTICSDFGAQKNKVWHCLSALGFLWKEWCWSWNSSTSATSWEELTHWKRLWCWEGLGAGGEGDDRGWDGWMASLTRWTWVWVNSGSWWWTGRPGVLQFMGSQRVGHDWATDLIWSDSFPGGPSGDPIQEIRNAGSIPWSGRSPGGGHDNLLQYFCLENLLDRGAWWATVYRSNFIYMKLYICNVYM